MADILVSGSLLQFPLAVQPALIKKKKIHNSHALCHHPSPPFFTKDTCHFLRAGEANAICPQWSFPACRVTALTLLCYVLVLSGRWLLFFLHVVSFGSVQLVRVSVDSCSHIVCALLAQGGCQPACCCSLPSWICWDGPSTAHR